MNPGDRAVLFINGLRHGKGQWAGQPFNLRPWQEKIVRDLFGTLREDGLRQYRTAWLELPRKNGKTHLAAAIALYLLVGDMEPGAEVILAAVDRDQASLAYDVAVAMVRQSPYLSGRLKVVPSTRRIVDPETHSYLRAIAADALADVELIEADTLLRRAVEIVVPRHACSLLRRRPGRGRRAACGRRRRCAW